VRPPILSPTLGAKKFEKVKRKTTFFFASQVTHKLPFLDGDRWQGSHLGIGFCKDPVGSAVERKPNRSPSAS